MTSSARSERLTGMSEETQNPEDLKPSRKVLRQRKVELHRSLRRQSLTQTSSEHNRCKG